MSNLKTQVPTDTWFPATWEEYLEVVKDPACAKAKGYYYRHYMRVEMSPIGFDHSTDHGLIALAVGLYAILRQIPLTAADNCTYRKAGEVECQPDLSYYLGEKAQTIPKDTGIVDLDQYPPPDLVVEIAKTSLLDDLGIKRSLYEALGVAEYWVVDVENTDILAYAMSNRGSYRIEVSQVLPGLAIATLTEALQLSRQSDQSQVGAWLMSRFSQDQR
jgi:Uma2 family endonuclease